MNRRKDKKEENMAIGFVTELQNQFTEPIIENIDKFLDEQNYSPEDKAHFRKMLMITIGNSVILKSKASRKEIKQAYRGLIADYEKLM